MIAQKVIHPFVTDCTFNCGHQLKVLDLYTQMVKMLARAASSQTSWRSSMWMLAPLDVRTGVLPPGPTGSLTTVTVRNGRPCDLQYSARLFASSSVCRPRATPLKETIWNSIRPCAICTKLMNFSKIERSNTLRAFLAQSRVSCQSKNTTRLLPMAPRS